MKIITQINPKLNPIVDADLLVYRCGFAADAQAKKDFGGDYLEHDYLSWALANTRSVMDDILDHAFSEHTMYWAFLTGKGNFRHDLATIKVYKGNRDTSHRPKYYKEIQQYLTERFQAVTVEGIEADDAVATTQWSHRDKSTVLVSTDKDLDMIPGYHFNWVKGIFYSLTLDEANLNFFRQMLVGDTTDNIPGIKGLGAVKTERLLPDGTSTEDAQHIVKQEYQREFGGGWEAAYHEISNLLWMRREENQTCPF